MKLYQHKYIPKEYNEFLFNQDKFDLINNLNKNSCIFNTIIYGQYGSGKKSIANYLLDNYFNSDKQIYNLKQINYTINETDLCIFKSPYHYEIDANDNNYNDKNSGDLFMKL